MSYGTHTVLDDISLQARLGELIVLLGPSGCGKTTLLRAVAGFVRHSRGRIRLGAIDLTPLRPNERGVGIVFQSYALFPHMTVAENIAYGVEARGGSRAVVATRVAEMVTLLHLTGLERRLPRQLSGGQQQRVALGRALAVRPQLLLLDEPFAALDRGLRLEMQIELKRLQRQLGISTILVTHDQEEALSLADRIAVMNAGAIEQFASPSEIYTAPVSAFVNSFIGTTNFLAVRIDGAAGDLLQLSLPSGTVLPVVCGGPWRERGEARLSIRPEQFMLTTAVGLLSGTVSQVLPLGASTLVQVALDDGSLVKVMVPTALGEPVPQTGAKTGLAIRGGAVLRAYPP